MPRHDRDRSRDGEVRRFRKDVDDYAFLVQAHGEAFDGFAVGEFADRRSDAGARCIFVRIRGDQERGLPRG